MWQQDEHTWMDAPAAYQNGPEMPKFHATLDDWSRVAAHVHCDTITCGGGGRSGPVGRGAGGVLGLELGLRGGWLGG